MEIYFIQPVDGGPIKIGMCKDDTARRRLFNIQISNHLKLRVMGVIKNVEYRDKKLHRQFKKYHIRGEWFEPAPELLEFIEQNVASNSNVEYTDRWSCTEYKLRFKCTRRDDKISRLNKPRWTEEELQFLRDNYEHGDKEQICQKLKRQWETIRAYANQVLKLKRATSSVHRGVGFHKQSGKWAARITLDGVHISLGLFDTEEEAYQARLLYEKENVIDNQSERRPSDN